MIALYVLAAMVLVVFGFAIGWSLRGIEFGKERFNFKSGYNAGWNDRGSWIEIENFARRR